MTSLAPAPAPATPLVSLRAITKRFPGVLANDDVSLDLLGGEVHVLLGENGAGKSTLVGMLSGLLQPDAGEILIEGRPTRIQSPRHALDLGIGTVFQHSMLVPSLSLVDNFALGGPWWKAPDRRGIANAMRAAAQGVGISIDPMARAGALSLGEQQQAEIVRALMRGSRCLILDEATAMLTPADADQLGALMRRLVETGLAVVFITHKLDEALAFGDRVSVLRLGRNAGTLAPEDLASGDTEAATEAIVRLMFGTTRIEEGAAVPHRPAPGGEIVFSVRGLSVDDDTVPVRDVDFDIASGEILGIAGIDGNGQRQLAEALAGQRPLASGALLVDGADLAALDVGTRRRRGLRYVSDDRLGEATVGTLPVSVNLLLKQIGDSPFWRRGVERGGAIADHARKRVDEFDVRTPSIETPVAKLSGGNIQKVLLARELSGTARAVIFAKPTYGLDVQNIVTSRRRIRETAADGRAVLLISTDLEELLELADRIAVMSRGRIVGTVPNDADARRRVGELMSGLSR